MKVVAYGRPRLAVVTSHLRRKDAARITLIAA